ncbi:MAG: DUF6152 family protein [Pseudomonadota bacterium]
MNRFKMAGLLTVLVGGVALPALAHHSFAMFDQTKQVALKGTVTEFQWTNPHAFIHIDVPTGDTLAGVWDIELNSPNNLKRQGWKSTSLKPGDKVTVMANPLREMSDGKKGGLFITVTLADGTMLGIPTTGPINVPTPAEAAPKK